MHIHIRRPHLWKMVGFSFLIGGGLPLLADMANFTRTWVVDADALRIGVWSSFVVLLGIAELAAGRMMRAVKDSGAHHSWLWTAMATLGPLAGGVMLALAWNRAMGWPQTRNHIALALGGGFLLLAGLIALASERVVRLREHDAEATPLTAQPNH